MASPSPNGSDAEIINHSTADLTTSTTETPTRPPPLTRASTSALEKCWICLSTRDEDPPSPPNPPTEWRSPCSCSLQAHESCLLDWIADQEAPRSRGGGRSGPSPDKILCPQCRSEIKVQRSMDPLVHLCRRIDRTYSRFVLPGLAASLTGTILSGCYMHGRWAVSMVFGHDAAMQIYRDALHNEHSGHLLAYSLVPLNLIFARTRYADFVLPSSTLYLIGTQLNSDYGFDWTTWPPHPATAFALLPAVRQSYNWLYEQAFGELNRKWIKEVQPRREEGYEGQEGNIANILNEHEAEMAEAGDDGGVVLELELNLGAVENDEEALAEVIDAAQQEAREQEADGQPQADEGNGGGRVHQLLGDNELMDDTSSIGQLVIGSLVIPAVANVAGNLLQLALPLSWTRAVSSRYARPNLLSNKWARSLVGGLAFVAVKDMLVLYCRWRLAEGHKKRKIMDYDKKKKEYVSV